MKLTILFKVKDISATPLPKHAEIYLPHTLYPHFLMYFLLTKNELSNTFFFFTEVYALFVDVFQHSIYIFEGPYTTSDIHPNGHRIVILISIGDAHFKVSGSYYLSQNPRLKMLAYSTKHLI